MQAAQNSVFNLFQNAVVQIETPTHIKFVLPTKASTIVLLEVILKFFMDTMTNFLLVLCTHSHSNTHTILVFPRKCDISPKHNLLTLDQGVEAVLK